MRPRFLLVRQFTLGLVLLAPIACRSRSTDASASNPPAAPRPADFGPVLTDCQRTVESFFGRPFARHFDFVVFPDRAAFDQSFPPSWGIEHTECWMVACGVADRLCLLSPSVWREQACEHDPDDATHVRGIVAHELVHVFHGQSNPSGDFSAVEGLDWFVEGLATYASGQLEEHHVLSAADAIGAGAAPEHLADAWKGKYRYGVSGSLVRFLDRRLGRGVINQMLSATTQPQVLSLAGMSESELLSQWRESVLAESAAHH
jgi:hypothetical protein